MADVNIRIGLGSGPACHRPLGIPPGIRQRGRPIPQAGPSERPPRRGSGKRDIAVEWVLEEDRTKEKQITAMLNDLLKVGVSAGMMPEFDRLNEQLGQVQRVIRNTLDRLGR